MRIDAAHSHLMPLRSLSRQAPSQREAQDITRPKEATGVPSAAAPDTAEHTKGVLRLLQDGHFRGVADVRLRLNFQDELSGVESEALASEVGDRLDGLLSFVSDRVEGVLTSGNLDEESAGAVETLHAEFLTTIDTLTESLANGEFDRDSFVSAVQAAQESLAGAIQDLRAGDGEPTDPVGVDSGGKNPADAAGAGAAAPAIADEALAPELVSPEAVASPESVEAPDRSGTPVESVSLQSFLEDLDAFVSEELASLEQYVSTANVLPELSPPNGNGNAYEKFLAQYRESFSSATAALAPPQLDAFA